MSNVLLLERKIVFLPCTKIKKGAKQDNTNSGSQIMFCDLRRKDVDFGYAYVCGCPGQRNRTSGGTSGRNRKHRKRK